MVNVYIELNDRSKSHFYRVRETSNLYHMAIAIINNSSHIG